MEFQNSSPLELISSNGEKIEMGRYVETDDEGLLSIAMSSFNEERRRFEPLSEVRRGLKRKFLRPVPPPILSKISLGEALSVQQMVEARKPFGYVVCRVIDVLKDGMVLIKHTDEEVERYHRRDLRKHLKYRRRSDEWIDRSFRQLG